MPVSRFSDLEGRLAVLEDKIGSSSVLKTHVPAIRPRPELRSGTRSDQAPNAIAGSIASDTLNTRLIRS